MLVKGKTMSDEVIQPLPIAGSNFVQIHNDFFDKWIKKVNGSECLILCFVARKTLGWHKQEDWISKSQFEKGTNLTKPTLLRNLKSLVAKKMLIVRQEGELGDVKMFYRLNIDNTGKKTIPVKKCSYPGKETLPPPVKKLYWTGKETLPTKDTITKETITKDIFTKETKFFNTDDNVVLIPNKNVRKKTREIFLPVSTLKVVESPQTEGMVELFISRLELANNKIKITDWQKKAWIGEVNALIKEGHSYEDIKLVIEFVFNNDFWQNKVISMQMIRRKFAQLWGQAQEPKKEKKYIVGHSEPGESRHRISKERLKAYLVGVIQGENKGGEIWEPPYVKQLVESGLTKEDLTEEDYKKYGIK